MLPNLYFVLLVKKKSNMYVLYNFFLYLYNFNSTNKLNLKQNIPFDKMNQYDTFIIPR